IYLSFLITLPPPPRPTLFPYTTLFRSRRRMVKVKVTAEHIAKGRRCSPTDCPLALAVKDAVAAPVSVYTKGVLIGDQWIDMGLRDRKSTRLNSSHVKISYAVFCLKKKK